MRVDRSRYLLEFSDDFTGAELDRSKWIRHYLPQWSSRALSAARSRIADGRLALLIEEDQPAWAPELNGGLRVSNLQTGVFAGPVGSTVGQHQFAPGLRVRESQLEQRLFTPHFGLIEARIAATSDPRSMVALWMIGFEDEPTHSAEICIFEIFGSELTADAAIVGMGVHPFGDPGIRDDFRKVPVAVDAREFHTYSAEWLPDEVRFFIDDELVTSVDQSPNYPMQLMLNIYEFEGEPSGPYPKRFDVDWVRGYRPMTG
ncbi:glycoside hydrolase family 16 protein [Salinibacterium sp. ZJ454]|uniref:glycoside hydrolase family 16 protein n=1 Tax=Salinibacterium sp. ZJ454 TaxID=2708339 RepID=UPI001422CF7D|nr:glycoside hydrolase family 16 protein [Salinibacterium sp. ZJ454]